MVRKRTISHSPVENELIEVTVQLGSKLDENNTWTPGPCGPGPWTNPNFLPEFFYTVVKNGDRPNTTPAGH